MQRGEGYVVVEATRIFRDITVAPFDMFELASKTSVSIQDLWLDSVQKETVSGTTNANRRSAIRCWDSGTGITCQRLRFRGLRFTKFTSAEVQAEGTRGVITVQKCSDVEVTGCSFDDNRATAVFWLDSEDVRVRNNFYRGEQVPYDPTGPATGVGSFVSGQASGVDVTDNRTMDSAYTMINVSGIGVTVSGNTILRPRYSGITISELTPVSEDVTVSGNTIRNPGLDGITVCECNLFDITGNTISGVTTSARAGIQFLNTIGGSSPTNGTAAANDVSLCVAGVRVRAGVDISISENTFRRNGVGVIFQSSQDAGSGAQVRAHLTGNKFIDNTNWAVEMNAAATVQQTVNADGNKLISSTIVSLQSSGFVVSGALSRLNLGVTTTSSNYVAEYVETNFANRATKAFVTSSSGVIARLKTVQGVPMSGALAYDPPSLADGAGANAAVAVTGAEVGDIADVTFSTALPAGVLLSASFTAAGTATVRFQNESGATQDIAPGTLTVVGRKV